MSTYGSIPNVSWGEQVPGADALFYSRRDAALLLDKAIKPGYGVLQAGWLMGVAADGQLVPYVMTGFAATGLEANAVVFGLADVANGANTIDVPLAASYRFKVGDVLALGETDGPTYHNGGAITDIDRTSSPVKATITFTTATTTAAFTTANSVHCYIATGSSGKLSEAVYVLDKAVDTGEGETAAGGLTSVVVSNAVLNAPVVIGMDSAAQTTMGLVVDGDYVILK